MHEHTSGPFRIPATGWIQTLLIFGGAGVLLYVGTHGLIPWLSHATGLETVVCWFLVGGLGVFLPLIVLGWVLLRSEARLAGRVSVLWTERLRLRRMNRGDWLWVMGALGVIGVLSFGIQAALALLPGGVGLQPSFMRVEPLSPGRYWVLLAWIPFWLLNILGEEFLWRGVVLPRQQSALEGNAWVANAAGWLLFHAAFGWQIILVLLPIVVVLPFVVQRRGNSWVGVFIHAGLNGPGFLAVAFGLA